MEPDEATVKRELRQGIADTKFLEQHWERLLQEHRDAWVGVYQKETIFSDSLEGLFEAARSKGWDLGVVVIDHLVEERPAVLL
jgi:hypothetical protein